MSDTPKKRVPTRHVAPPGGTRGDGPPPRPAAPPPRVAGTPTRPVGSAPRRTAPPSQYTNVYAAPKRDVFPYVMGGVIGALVVGLIVVVIILSAGNNGNGAVPIASGNPTSNSAINPAPQASIAVQAEPTSEYEPVRMELATFKSLYDDPAKRPVIIDVRRQDIYDSGHIAGSIDVPFEELDANLSKIPKDKMVILYCQ